MATAGSAKDSTGILQGKTAVVTGGSDGIGLAIARGFAREGANVLLIGRDQEKLERARTQLVELDATAHALAADLSEPSAIPGLVARILEYHPQIDILVNNAGTARFTPFAQVGDDELDNHLNLNVRAPYRLTQGLLGTLEANKGCVINISSYFAERMLPGRPSTAYSLTKGALNAFTKALAFELGPLGVRVNAIAPGTVNTTLVQRNIEQLSVEGQQHFAEMVKTIYPLGRIGEPEDLAGIAVYLASDQACWVTGSIFQVDGGLTTN